jgi:hypothetical protein
MKMMLKPGECMRRNLFKRTGLFEKMRGIGYDYQMFRAGEPSVGCSVHLEDRLIVFPNNQQSRRGD